MSASIPPRAKTLADVWTTTAWPRRRAPIILPGIAAHASHTGPPCLVHIVRTANGLECLRTFATALRRHPPGIDCELVFAMKGFRSLEEAQPYLEEVADLEPEALFLPDVGEDHGTFFAAAACLHRDRYCFLNSFSTPLVDGWLAKLDAALGQPGVGLVGATGSWASTRSWIAHMLGLPSAYRGALPPPRVVRQQLLALKPVQAARGRRSPLESLHERMLTLRALPIEERFPAHYVRTTAFMISHATLRRLRLYTIRDKLDALEQEGGRRGITRQVEQLGLHALVVDRTGASFDWWRWDRSHTFYQGIQEGLLVADNRTLAYEHGDAALRRVLSGITWGRHARPA